NKEYSLVLNDKEPSSKIEKKISEENPQIPSINVSDINEIEESNMEGDQFILDRIKSKMTSEELANGPVKVTLVMKKKFMQNTADLTPLPKVRKVELVNKVEEQEFH